MQGDLYADIPDSYVRTQVARVAHGQIIAEKARALILEHRRTHPRAPLDELYPELRACADDAEWAELVRQITWRYRHLEPTRTEAERLLEFTRSLSAARLGVGATCAISDEDGLDSFDDLTRPPAPPGWRAVTTAFVMAHAAIVEPPDVTEIPTLHQLWQSAHRGEMTFAESMRRAEDIRSAWIGRPPSPDQRRIDDAHERFRTGSITLAQAHAVRQAIERRYQGDPDLLDPD